MQFSLFQTDWGHVGFVADRDRLQRVWLPQPERRIRRALQRDFPDASESPDLLQVIRDQMESYYTGAPVDFAVDFDLTGQTEFRRRVLMRCARIPYGRTCSYGDLARRVGRPGAARAVGSAMAHNPIPLVIPCHRVVASDGSIGGFSSPGGCSLKERMLRLERETLARQGRTRTVSGVPAVA